MSCTQIEFIATDINLIKNETDFNWEPLYGNSSEELDDFFRIAAKCGDVFYSANGEFAFSCFFCDGRLKGFDRFVNHINISHVEIFKQNLADDVEIGSKENTEDSDEDHFKSRTPSPDESLMQDRKLLEIKLEDAREKYECVICKRNFKSHSILTKHRKIHQQETENDPPKELQVDSGNVETDLNQEKQLKCRYCCRKFIRRKNLMLHEKKHELGLMFQCTICPKSFPREYQLKEHLNTHTGARPHKCKECPLAFTNQSNLHVHIRRVHTGEKRFQCDFCEKCFVTTSELKIHVRSHTGEKPYQCEECGKRFLASSSLHSHKSRQHLKMKRFSCEICSKMFLTRSCLKNHSVVHSNEKPFECSICGAVFPRRKALLTHLKIHSDVREYSCKLCGKAFAQHAGLYSHMKSHGFNKETKPKKQSQESGT